MESPFPGMDPYIEARGLWGEITKDQGAPQGAAQRAQAMLNLYGGADGAVPPAAK